jgi:hypothetical protein
MNSMCLKYLSDLLNSFFSMKRPMAMTRSRVRPDSVDTLFALAILGAPECLDSSSLMIIE